MQRCPGFYWGSTVAANFGTSSSAVMLEVQLGPEELLFVRYFREVLCITLS